jgi:hypothetical protein
VLKLSNDNSRRHPDAPSEAGDIAEFKAKGGELGMKGLWDQCISREDVCFFLVNGMRLNALEKKPLVRMKQ